MALSGTSFSRSYTLDHQQDHTLLHIAFEITPALVPLLAGLYRGMYLRPDWLSIGGFGIVIAFLLKGYIPDAWIYTRCLSFHPCIAKKLRKAEQLTTQ